MTPPTSLQYLPCCLSRSNFDTGSAGWCSAQRIKMAMIAGGNHTIMQISPPYELRSLRAFPDQAPTGTLTTWMRFSSMTFAPKVSRPRTRSQNRFSARRASTSLI